MERRRIAKVAVDKTAFSFDKLFSYAVPQGMEPVPGGRVLVPFGRGNKPRQGMVFSLEPDSGELRFPWLVLILIWTVVSIW